MTITGHTLSGDCADLEREFPGWQAHASEDGWIWARETRGPWLHEPTALRMREAIARTEHSRHLNAVSLLAAPCPHRGCTHDRASHLDGTGACGWCACPSFGGEVIPFTVIDREVRRVA